MLLSRFKKYILAGKGTGLSLVFLTSLILVISACVPMWHSFNEFVHSRQIQTAIDSLPLIKIKEGVVITPIYDKKVLPILTASGEKKVIIDTAHTDIDGFDSDVMMYITSTKMYVRASEEIKSQTFPKELTQEFTHETIKNLIDTTIILVLIVFALTILGVAFIGFLLLWCIITAFGFLFNNKISGKMWGRILSLSWCFCFALYTVSKTISGGIIPFSTLCYLPLIITFFIGYRLKNISITQKPDQPTNTAELISKAFDNAYGKENKDS